MGEGVQDVPSYLSGGAPERPIRPTRMADISLCGFEMNWILSRRRNWRIVEYLRQ